MRFGRLCGAVLTVLIGANLAMAQTTQPADDATSRTTAPVELTDNPQFTAWKDFAVGSSQTMESTMTSGEKTMTMTTTQELTGKTADVVTIKISAEMEMAGEKQSLKPHVQEVPAKAPQQKMTEIGREQIAVAGESFDATVFQIVGGNNMTAKVWFCSKVPGGVVRVVMENAQGALKGELKSYQVK